MSFDIVQVVKDNDWTINVFESLDFAPDELATALSRNEDPEWDHPFEPIHTTSLVEYVEYLEQMLPRATKSSSVKQLGSNFVENVETLVKHIDEVDLGGSTLDLKLRVRVLVYAQVLRAKNSPRLRPLGPVAIDHHQEQTMSRIRHIMRKANKPSRNVEYWNYAAVFRHIYCVWYEPEWSEDKTHDWSPKWRFSSVTLLQKLHRRALKEVRTATALALGRIQAKLSAELQELIYEATLESEQVPQTLPTDLWRYLTSVVLEEKRTSTD